MVFHGALRESYDAWRHNVVFVICLAGKRMIWLSAY